MSSNSNLALVVAVVLIGTVTSGTAPSLVDYTSASNRLKGLLGTSALLPEAVRLAFHDCVGPNGCDGCVNLNMADNAGLEEIITFLVEERDASYPSISNADFWQIAGVASIELSSSDGVVLTFKGGRDDCSTSPDDDTADHDFPTPDMSRALMMDWFANNESGFSMTEDEVTALMGAHALGALHFTNSGYRGAFTPDTFVFDNDFYQVLNNADLTFDNTQNMRTAQLEEGETDLKFSWTVYDDTDDDEDTEYHLLNTDIELAYDIDVDNSGSGTQCLMGVAADGATDDACSEATTKDLVATYAEDQAQFFLDFATAYEKMMEVKHTGLTEPV